MKEKVNHVVKCKECENSVPFSFWLMTPCGNCGNEKWKLEQCKR